MTGPPIALACLDMAGTTVTDDGAVETAFDDALAAGGVERRTAAGQRAADYIRDTMGQSKIEVFRVIFDGDAARADAANRRFEGSYAESVAAGKVGAVPGAEDAIDELRRHGVKVCLTTGFSPATRDALVDALGWRDRVDLVLSPADCGRGRPYPDMILHAVIALEVDDVAAVAVAGDTASDIVSGRRAGASVVAGVLTGAHGRADLEAAKATHVLDSVADLPVLVLPKRPPFETGTAHS